MSYAKEERVIRIALPDEASLKIHSAGKFNQIVNLMQEYWQVWSIDNQQPIRFVRMSSTSALEALHNNNVDIIAISVARESPNTLFSVPYAKYQQRIFRRLNAGENNTVKMAIHSPTDRVLAAMTPYVEQTFYRDIDWLLDNYQQYNAIYSVQPWELERKLKERQIDNFFYASTNESPNIFFRFAFREDDMELALAVNNSLRAISQLQAKLWTEKYIIKNENRFILTLGDYDQTLSLDEQKFVLKQPHLKFPSAPEGFAPYLITESFNNVGATGFTIDLFKLFTQKLGLTFEPVYVSTGELGHSLVKSSELDFYHLFYNDGQSSPHLAFSNSYIHTDFSLITRDDYILRNHLSSLTLEHIGVIEGFISTEQLPRLLPEAKYSYYSSTKEALDALDSGEVNAVVEPTLSSSYAIKHHGYAHLTSQPLHGFINELPLSFAALQTNADIILLLNRGLSLIAPEQYERLYAKWNTVAFSDNDIYEQVSDIYQRAGYILLTIFFMSVLMTIFYVYQLRLRRAAQHEVEQALVVAEEARASAEQSGIAKTSFLARMSHEIRTPMNGVFGMAEALSYTDLDKHQKELLKTLTTSADNLMTILDDVLDFSKMDAGKMTLESVPVNLSELVQNVVNVFTPLSHQKGVRLKLRVDSRLSRQYLFDPTRLTQVLNNLVSNALKFTEFGVVEVKLMLEKREHVDGSQYDSIYFSVIDTGIGISKEQQNLLFSPFSQADSAVTRRFGGTGLGLSICHEIVNAMGGKIAIDSQENKGSTFFFTLTLKTLAIKDVDPIDVVPEQKSEIPDFSQLSVLLVEDNLVNVKVLTAQLERLNILPDIAYNGKEALTLHQENPYDLIISDCHMPEMDGFELATTLAKQPKTKPFWIVAVTADALADTANKCIEAGFNDYMTKPCPQDEITAKMANAYQQLEQQKAHFVANKVQQNSKKTMFDGERLLDRNGHDKVLTNRVCSLFLESWAEEQQALTLALSKKDFEQLAAITHKLKGSLRYLAVEGIEQHINAVETLCRSQNGGEIKTALDKLISSLNQVNDEIQYWLNQ